MLLSLSLNTVALLGNKPHNTKEQSHHEESIQKRAFRIVFGMSLRGRLYIVTLVLLTILTLWLIVKNLFVKDFLSRSVISKSSCSHSLLLEQNDCIAIDTLRHKSLFNLPTVCTNQFPNSLILYALEHYL
jgi:hypothetical protein